MITVNERISLRETEIQLEFIRSSGPGGQNVNKVASAVQLRFDVRNSPSLPEEVRERLTRIAGKQMTRSGVLIITARRYRHQERNREDAIARLVKWIQKAAATPKKRKKTKPTKGSVEKRLQDKRRKSVKKRIRAAGADEG